MTKDNAKEVISLLDMMSSSLDKSIKSVQQGCSEKASHIYTTAIGRVLGQMAVGLQFRLWKEYPDLEPDYMKAKNTYDPHCFEIPPQVADEAIQTIEGCHALVTQAENVLALEPDSAEKIGYLGEIAEVRKQLEDAARTVTRYRKEKNQQPV